MRTIIQVSLPPALALALLLGGAGAATLPAAALTIPPGDLAATKSGNDLILSFPTTSPGLYTVQTCPDLLQPWTNFQSGIHGDGTVKTVTINNALSGGKGFYPIGPARASTPCKLVRTCCSRGLISSQGSTAMER